MLKIQFCLVHCTKLLTEVQTRTYLSDVYNSILVKDIIARFNIKDLDLFDRILEYILADDFVVEREFGVFKSIEDNYPKYVLTMDKFDF